MCHVLIIEDEPLIALDIEDLLREYGALTFSFADTQDDAVTRSHEQRPDFILSDVWLLQGTGPLAVESIRQEYGTVPVIFVTATPEACTPCAPGRIFRKPLNRPAIGEAFRQMRAAS
ncbi:MAG: response regulator [Sphingomonas sp.]|nr:response regulator [Sphingomonas sp.]